MDLDVVEALEVGATDQEEAVEEDLAARIRTIMDTIHIAMVLIHITGIVTMAVQALVLVARELDLVSDFKKGIEK